MSRLQRVLIDSFAARCLQASPEQHNVFSDQGKARNAISIIR
jgi:hypothetical protein